MIKQLKKSKFKKTIAIYLAMMILLETLQPMRMYALTGGPSQPEFESFTPIGTSDMVDLASGDLNYNIPIMDVGGYPLNLAYNSGVTMDQEASWVGLGWDLNVGQISRQLRGLPDDFNGDEMIYENNMKPNVTIGGSASTGVAVFGAKEGPAKLNVGIGIKYNNYDGIGVTANGGLSYQINDHLNVGMNLESSASEGVSVSPNISFNSKITSESTGDIDLGVNAGVSYNSRKGVESSTMSFFATKRIKNDERWAKDAKETKASSGTSGSLSFIDASYTPTKRVGMVSSNFMFNLNMVVEAWGIEPHLKFSGYRTSQGIKDSEKYKIEKGYGFENSYNAGNSDVLDFNREKDRTFNKNTTSLPITNNTYDLYSIQGQGVSGMFRPYKSQVSYVYDKETIDDSNGGSLGVEAGAGGGWKWGYDATVTVGKSSTSLWKNQNPALIRFKEKKTGNSPDYEKVFFKNIGGTHVDKELDLLNTKLEGFNPIMLPIKGDKFYRSTSRNYSSNYKTVEDNNSNTKIARINRLARNQSIEKLTKVEAKKYGYNTQFSNFSRNHHTAEIRVTKEGGERYVYGRAAYNVTKKETTFDVGSNPKLENDTDATPIFNKKDGLVRYSETDNSSKNNQEGDQYFNRVTTPAYAHTYLLTSVLSSDYQDVKGDGPSDDDLGTYTKFDYDNKNTDKTHTYKWRIPFNRNLANYDEGLRSSKKDNKGNYIYGEKELLYIKKITTKTHIAIFHLSERKDGYGVADENGGLGEDSKMYKLDSINLYSKPEYTAYKENATPIKTAHFDYSYDLCKGIDNYFNKNSVNEKGGKLTLQRVYFTYKNSNMGKYTPYVFNYDYPPDVDNTFPDTNPNYDMKAYDVWGNYKPTNSATGYKTLDALSNAEYPFVDQSDKTQADKYASAWLLKSIELPSGGILELNYESDDYGHVQDKEAMQMFKVVGSGTAADINDFTENREIKNLPQSFGSSDSSSYIYVQLDRKINFPSNVDTSEYFKKNYLKTIGEEINPLYFRFLLNMVGPENNPKIFDDDKYDYVTGYTKIDKSKDFGFKLVGQKQYVAIPLETVKKGDGIEENDKVNPISKAGWNFGRKYLNRLVYSLHKEEDTNNIKGIVMELIGWLPALKDIFTSPNQQLKNKGIASRFIANKSWVRLLQQDGSKLGGGSRVKEVKISDQWNLMTSHNQDKIYEQQYGQTYTYKNEDGKSSGVATYEPLGCKENPFVKPAYDRTRRDLLLGPDTDNYVEEPFGESFFPAPKVTYSRVTVANLARNKTDSNNVTSIVKKHATGTVVTEFYTSKDFPTITDRTTLSSNHDASTALASILGLKVRDHITMSQGFTIHTNDMDGKMKSQRVYPEGQSGTKFISGVDYNYNYNTYSQTSNLNKGKLNNTIQTIDSDGNISQKLVGVDYDVINDFRENKSTSSTYGVHLNFVALPVAFIIAVVPVPIPSISSHENQIRTAVTTKVIHTSGILSEKVAYDLGAKVETKNLAWDAETGDVLLTETVNEYNDHYFNFNYPAYWYYDGMSQAAKNIGLEWGIETSSQDSKHEYQFKNGTDNTAYKASDYLINGDELWISGTDPLDTRTKKGMKAWVVKLSQNTFEMIDQNGLLIKKDAILVDKIKVIRSGHRNMQMASMASITSMRNPLYNYTTNHTKDKIENPTEVDKIVNASAISYKDVWPAQCECNLPKMIFDIYNNPKFGYDTYTPSNSQSVDQEDVVKNSYNPYLYNILGNWRADKSYAYLTGRNFNPGTTGPTPRNSGFFTSFNPFYVLNNDNKWIITPIKVDFDKWTYASEVTKYNPYGQEVENKDALKRYSSALYGYNNRFPVAVASNTKYSELASDSFEDYDFSSCGASSHFDFLGQLKINEVSVSSKQSHTGKRSLKIAPSKKAVLKKQIAPCTTAPVTP